ncbi:hypothetical protein GCM10010842_29380 [Deinococcus daejeonensis]|uniref:Helix-turn-helix domain-containing protein n=1 Tax=Deinococcus daejeonensis TaxID=1007098 RepID=A0ABQ2JA05_9DEIO|nr:hypothetical protein GCM10010842_29380 [Deinococcus daejeonensis]
MPDPAPPAVLLSEWAAARRLGSGRALTWAQRGDVCAWRSSVGWLIRPDEPEPDGTAFPVILVKCLSRAERLTLPAVSLPEWADLHGHPRQRVAAWAAQGRLPTWRSGSAWLIAPGTVPPPWRGNPGASPETDGTAREAHQFAAGPEGPV